MAQALFPEKNAIFQDDNAPMHTARIVKEWHEEHCNEVKHIVWPAQSSDLNIIEHLWSVLEIQVRHRYPLPSSLKELGTIMTEEWLKIPLKTIHNPQEAGKHHMKLYFVNFLRCFH